jgi:TRAP-type uncharacterized transport system substrate-binding protein
MIPPGPSPRRVALYSALALVAVGASVGVAVTLLHPMPPRTLVMATGPEGSAHREIGLRYRELLARDGIKLELPPSNGAVDNLASLSDPASAVSVALLQGGIAPESRRTDGTLVSLGTVFLEPVWFFHNLPWDATGEQILKGRRVSIGVPGSGTRAMADLLLKVNRLEGGTTQFVEMPPLESAEALLAGKIDAALVAAPWNDAIMKQLMTSGRVALFSYPRADAWVALYPFLTRLVLPMGVADMGANIPPHDVTLFAPKASLVVREDLHPALQYLLLRAASQIHSRPDIFQGAGRFPAAEADDFPLSEHARQFYKSGPPWLQRYLPFWLAVLAGQALLFLIPVVGILYPLLRGAPALYGWTMRRRIYRLYGELKFLEADLESASDSGDFATLNRRLDAFEKRVSRFRIPRAFVPMLYTLKQHIALVRARIDARARPVA